MLSSSAALGHNLRCLNANRTYIQGARFASRLSSIKRGIQGETSAEPRRFDKRPSGFGDRFSSDRTRSSATRSARRENRSSSDGSRGSPATSSRRDYDDVKFDEPRRSSDRPPRRDFDRPSDEPRKSFGRPTGRDDDGPRKSFGRTDDRPQRSSEKPSFGRSDGKSQRSFDTPSFGRSDDRPRRSTDKPSFGRSDDRPQRSFDKPWERDDERSRRPFDRSFPGKNDDEPRRSFDKSSRDRDFGSRDGDSRGSFNKPSRDNDFRSRDSDSRPSSDRSFRDRDFKDRDHEPRKVFEKFSERRSEDRSEKRLDARALYDGKPMDRDSRGAHSSRDDNRQSGSKFSSSGSFTKKDDDYVSIPYTTAASEFLYGLNVVYAALKSRKRSLYTLYLHSRAKENKYKGVYLERLAQSSSVKIRRVEDNFLPTLDKMADGRPHNGVILEVSPLPIPAVGQLGKIEASTKQIQLVMADNQTAEERALHGITKFLPAPTEGWRQPVVLLVDGILDPGNLGNILRTAYFYGVDAVAVCVNTCAPLTSPVLHKAASGATEALNIIAIQRPAEFVSACSRNGWRIHAAVAPESEKSSPIKKSQFSTNKMVSPLARAPSLLMMGAEGEGLRLNLRTKAGYNVLIAGQQRHAKDDLGVDSLNVSAATAVLIEAFMRPPVETRESRMKNSEKGTEVKDSVEQQSHTTKEAQDMEQVEETVGAAKSEEAAIAAEAEAVARTGTVVEAGIAAEKDAITEAEQVELSEKVDATEEARKEESVENEGKLF